MSVLGEGAYRIKNSGGVRGALHGLNANQCDGIRKKDDGKIVYKKTDLSHESFFLEEWSHVTSQGSACTLR